MWLGVVLKARSSQAFSAWPPSERALGLYATSLAREQVQLDRFTIRVAKPGLPPSGLTILHLTDFHFRANGRVQARKLAELQRLLAGERYDLVALTGDLIHDTAGLPKAFALIRSLSPRCGAYFVPGNHDYAEYTQWGMFGSNWHERADGGFSAGDLRHVVDAFKDFVRKIVRNELVRMPVCFNDVSEIIAQLESVGVQSLVNKSMRLPLDGGEVWLAGVDDEMESKPDLGAALEGIPPGVPLILLAHNPDIWLQCGVDRADLVLSGHTHGGQIQLPFLGALHTQGTHLPAQDACRLVRARPVEDVREPRHGRKHPAALRLPAPGRPDYAASGVSPSCEDKRGCVTAADRPSKPSRDGARLPSAARIDRV